MSIDPVSVLIGVIIGGWCGWLCGLPWPGERKRKGRPPEEPPLRPSARKGAMTRAEYELRVEELAISAGSRFGRGNVALKAGYMYTPARAERERAAVLSKAGIAPEVC